MEGMGMSNFWLDRPTLVTGATGLVGSWLVKYLLEAQADVVCLIRDWVPHSELVRTKLIDRAELTDVPVTFKTIKAVLRSEHCI